MLFARRVYLQGLFSVVSLGSWKRRVPFMLALLSLSEASDRSVGAAQASFWFVADEGLLNLKKRSVSGAGHHLLA